MPTLTASRKNRGIALMTTFVVLVFLLLLTGALIRTQAGVFAISKTSDAQMRADSACKTLYDFCLYQVEHQRNWGRPGFAGIGEVDPPRGGNSLTASLGTRIEIKGVDNQTFRGYLPEHSCHFEVKVHNAMTLDSGLNIGSPLETLKEHVRLEIVAWDGSDEMEKAVAHKRVDVLLRLAPLFDASVLTRGDIAIHASKMFLSSKDPFRNEMRTDGHADLPGLLSGKTRFVQYHPNLLSDVVDPDDIQPDHNGLLWATGEIRDGGNPLDQNQLRQAARSTSGRVIPNASKRLDVYNLTPENLPTPSVTEVELPSGEFRFTRQKAAVRVRRKVLINNTNDDDDGTWVWQPPTTEFAVVNAIAHYPPGSDTPSRLLTPNILEENENLQVLNVQAINEDNSAAGVSVELGNRFYLNPGFQASGSNPTLEETTESFSEHGIRSDSRGGGGSVYFDLNNNSFHVDPNTIIDVQEENGESKFEFKMEPAFGAMPPTPTLQLGSKGNDVVIRCKGDITLQGGLLQGLGTLISEEGDVNLAPQFPDVEWVPSVNAEGVTVYHPVDFKVDITSHQDYEGLVVFAGKDVNVTNPHDTDWTFRGFVYAKDRFSFDANNGNATFFGTVVAGQSSAYQDSIALEMENVDKLNFIYDPAYLKLLTRTLPNNWTRVEQVVWTERS